VRHGGDEALAARGAPMRARPCVRAHACAP
jgi:hypothetical protein